MRPRSSAWRSPLGARGDDLVGACPFCGVDDGLVVSPGPNLWRCGGCSAGGSVIDWVIATEGVSTRHALELLRDGFTPTRLNGRPPGRSTVRRLDGPFSPDVDDGELLDAVVGFYHQALLESPEARGYLAERRIAGRCAAAGWEFHGRATEPAIRTCSATRRGSLRRGTTT